MAGVLYGHILHIDLLSSRKTSKFKKIFKTKLSRLDICPRSGSSGVGYKFACNYILVPYVRFQYTSCVEKIVVACTWRRKLGTQRNLGMVWTKTQFRFSDF